MPFIKSSASKRRTCVVTVIFSLGEIIPTYSRCILKGLVYIAITALSSRQPSSYMEYTKSNIHSSCDIRSVSNAKCILPIYLTNF